MITSEQVLVSGQWKNITQSSILIDGAWKNVSSKSVLVNGIWQTTSGALISVSDNFTDYNFNDSLESKPRWTKLRGSMYINDYSTVKTVGGIVVGSMYVMSYVYEGDWSNNQYAEFELMRFRAEDRKFGCGVRMTGDGTNATGYIAYVHSSVTPVVKLAKFDNNIITALGQTTQTMLITDKMGLSVVGNELRLFKNGVLMTDIGTDGVVTDNTYTTGKPGLFIHITGGTYQLFFKSFAANDI